MKFILAKKHSMTQVFDEKGVVTPVTILSAGPMVVTQVKDMTRDGYKSVQLGYGVKKEKNLSKALKGHFKGLGSFAHVKEYRPNGDEALPEMGASIDVSVFAPGDTVAVSGLSKAKGFQGVVKRHGFAGGPRSHGQKHSEREPGSISGNHREGGRVPKGMRMAGRTGGVRITTRNLKVVQVNPEENLILVSGAVPGRRGTLLEIRG